MEKKKKGKGIVIAIIMLALVIGGYFVYDNFFSGSKTTEDIEAVEVKKVGFYPTEDIYFDLDDYKSDFFKILDNNEAYYYIAENAKGGIVVKQVNREDFDNFGPVKSSKAINTVKKGLKTFLNSRYDTLPYDVYGTDKNNQTTIFGKMNFSMEPGKEAQTFKNAIGSEIKELFNDYELVISCEDINIEKIAVYNCEESFEHDGFQGEFFDFPMIVNAEVVTEQAKKGVSEVSCFAEEGKSKNLKIRLYCCSDDYFKKVDLYTMFVE